MFKPTNIKGSVDCVPEMQIMRNRVTDILRKNFESYGYLPIETAQLNYLDLLTYKYDSKAEIVREIYKIKDQGDRDLGLRFDLTVPFCKFIAMNRNLKMPFKRYEIGKVWRNGPVKSGRAREFYQCDVDVVGVSGVYIEAELIALAIKCYLDIGIKPRVLYGNRQILNKLIANVTKSNPDAIIGIVDKMAKVSRDELVKNLCEYMTKDNAVMLLESLKNPEKNEDILQFETVLREMSIDKYCEFAPYLARGLNVYTGTVWEIFDAEKRITSSLGGGGRYDNIITNFVDNGQKYPAVGTSFGLEPICAVLNLCSQQFANSVKKSFVDLLLVPMDTESFCQKLADKYRAQGKNVLVYLGGGKVGKAFEYANAEKISYVAVVGENEIKSGAISVKNMATGQSEVTKI